MLSASNISTFYITSLTGTLHKIPLNTVDILPVHRRRYVEKCTDYWRLGVWLLCEIVIVSLHIQLFIYPCPI